MLACAAFMTMNAVAQTTAEAKPKPKKFHGNPDYYLEVQGNHLFRQADMALDDCPPMVNASVARKSALMILDALHHDTRYDNSEAMREFCNSRMEKVVAEIQTPVKKGLKVHRVYNEGFVAKTKSVTVAFDLVRGTYLVILQTADWAAREGIRLTVENVGYPLKQNVLFNQEEYIQLIKRLPQSVGALIDTGHAMANGWDIPELVEVLGDRI